VCLIFAITGASGLGTWVKGSVAPVLASESTSSLPGSPASRRLNVVVQSPPLLREMGRNSEFGNFPKGFDHPVTPNICGDGSLENMYRIQSGQINNYITRYGMPISCN